MWLIGELYDRGPLSTAKSQKKKRRENMEKSETMARKKKKAMK